MCYTNNTMPNIFGPHISNHVVKVELPCNVHGHLNGPNYITSILYQILKGVAVIVACKYY